jgi:hypothetical protein
MLCALAAGETNTETLAELAQGNLKSKTEQVPPGKDAVGS